MPGVRIALDTPGPCRSPGVQRSTNPGAPQFANAAQSVCRITGHRQIALVSTNTPARAKLIATLSEHGSRAVLENGEEHRHDQDHKGRQDKQDYFRSHRGRPQTVVRMWVSLIALRPYTQRLRHSPAKGQDALRIGSSQPVISVPPDNNTDVRPVRRFCEENGGFVFFDG